MKNNITIAALALGGVLVFCAGCGKNEEVAPPAAKDSPPSAGATTAQSQIADTEKTAKAAQAADAAKAEALKLQAEAEKQAATKAAAEKTAAEKLAQTAAAAAQETSRIQSLIASAKNLTGQNKYAEALKILGELANLKLTPEQQALVDGLKQTAEKQAAQAVADKAAAGASKAIGDVLGGKK